MNTPGYAAALADNPDCAGLLASLAAAPAREFPSVEPAVRAGLRIPLSDPAEAAAVSAAAVRLRRRARCHVALDTGM